MAVPYTVTEKYTYTFSMNLYNDTVTLTPSEPINISLLPPNRYLDHVTLEANGTVVQLMFSNSVVGGLSNIRVRLYYREISPRYAEHLAARAQELKRDFEIKLENYDEIYFYYNPGRFHPLYNRLIGEVKVKAKIIKITHKDQIV